MRLWHLTRLEATRQLTNARFRWVAAASVVLSMIAVNLGLSDYRFRKDQYDRNVQQLETVRQKDGGRLLAWSMEPGLRVLRPPSVNSILVRGLDAAMPSFWDLAPAGVIEGAVSPSLAQDTEVGSLTDLEALIRIVLGLLAVLLGCDAIALDRANGMLGALLSQPIRPAAVVSGKLLGAVITLSASVGVVLGTAGLTLLARGPDLFTRALAQCLFELAILATVYLCIILLVTVLLSLWIERYEAVLLAGLALWAYAALIGPQLVVFGARALAPVPPRQLMESERQGIFDARDQSTKELLGRAYRDTVGEPMPNFIDPKAPVAAEIDRLWRAETVDTRRMMVAPEDRLARASALQDRLTWGLALAEPGALFLELADGVANTGREYRTEWATAVVAYQSRVNAQLFDDRPRLVLLAPAVGRARMILNLDRHPFPSVRDLPGFTQPASRLRERASRSVGAIVALGAYLTALTVAVLRVFSNTRF